MKVHCFFVVYAEVSNEYWNQWLATGHLLSGGIRKARGNGLGDRYIVKSPVAPPPGASLPNLGAYWWCRKCMHTRAKILVTFIDVPVFGMDTCSCAATGLRNSITEFVFALEVFYCCVSLCKRDFRFYFVSSSFFLFCVLQGCLAQLEGLAVTVT